jgi:EAL domain-containing protein (putative c-di-GMP-specific phosphodiesterase class I)
VDRATVKIILLDDEPFILKLHTHMLAEAGFVSVRPFEQGALALDHLDQGGFPDLILLDLSMPGMDGIEFIRHLVKRRYPGRLILVSGEDVRLLQAAERLVAGHGIHVLGHLSKPIKPAGLRRLLDDWEQGATLVPRAPVRTYAAGEVLTAIRSAQLTNHYQPKISIATGELLGVECLVRWRHPEDGLVLPGRFIGVAEEHGLIDELTRAMLRQALSEIRQLELAGLPLRVSVNLATSTLTSIDFADFAAAEAERASVAPQNIVFEVTESQLIRDFRAPLEVLARLRLMRFGLSIDDFGTGYSSLSQLRDIPFDELKIDQTFVHRAASDPTARAIYDASLGLAQKLGLKAVAEGVEDREDWDLVQATGCDEAQGYLVARPMPLEALPAWRDGWRQRSGTEFGFS